MTYLIRWEPWQIALQLAFIIPTVVLILWVKFNSWRGDFKRAATKREEYAQRVQRGY